MPDGGGGGGGSQSSGAGGGGGGAQLDIIDLDRYMRGAVRPLPRRDLGRDRLVVDGGGAGVGAAGVRGGSQASCSSSGPPRDTRDIRDTRDKRDKRYSHDSGLSDGSYLRTRTRHARHTRSAHHAKRSEADGGRSRREGREGRETREARGEGEATDLRSFRAACERALRDQQEQIARVAALCERLTGSHSRRARVSSSDVSELSSTSRSRSHSRSRSRSRSGRDTRDSRRRDTHRVANEYKTYKIIMSKLDDLNRRLAARAGVAGAAGGARTRGGARGAPGVRRGDPSAGSSDRSAHHSHPATHPQGRTTRASSRLVERAVGDADEGCAVVAVVAGHELRSPSHVGEGCPRVGAGVGARSQLARLSPRRAHELDIPPGAAPPGAAPPGAAPPGAGPRPPPPRLNVATESVVQRCTSSSGESALLYAQSKRVKAPSRRSRSAEAAGTGHNSGRASKRAALYSSAGSERAAAGAGGPGGLGGLAAGFWRAPSLCYLCRSYWRALQHCVRQQFTPAL